MYIAWHFSKYRPVGRLLGIFENDQKAREVCSVGDCFYPIELNVCCKDETELLEHALYKCPSGEFRDCNEYLREIHEQEE